MQAATLFGARDYPACLAILRALLLDNPDDLTALALLLEAGSALNPNEKGKWALHAAHTINEIRRSGAMSERTAARTGQLLLRRGEIAAASAVGEWLERHFPSGAEAAIFLSEFYGRVGEPALAMARMTTASGAHPDDIDLALRVGERLVAWGRAAEALPIAEGLARRDAGPRTQLLLARARIASGAPDSGAALAEAALQAGASIKNIVGVALELLRIDASGATRKLIDALVAAAPDDAAVARLNIDALLLAGDHSGAATALQRLMDVEPSVIAGEALAEALLQQDRPQDAAALGARLAKLDPSSLAPDIIRAKALRAAGDLTAAEALDEALMVRAALEGTVPVRRQRVRMAGMIGRGGLGDFVYQLLALCSLKRQFVDAGLTLFYSNDFSYKRDVLRFCPDVEDLRDIADTGLSLSTNVSHVQGFRQHLFFSHAALSPTLLTRLDRTATLVVPPEDVDGLTAKLIARGVDPNRWFVVMHYRESGSFVGGGGGGIGVFHPGETRDVDPATFHRLAKSICESGGQVVRLGHPGMGPLPKVPGYIDLVDGGLPLQLFAVSKARFMIACDSGPTSYATAFKTPLLKTNAIYEDGAAYAHDLLLNKNLINWRGEVVSLGAVAKGGAGDHKALFRMLKQSALGFRLVDNTFEQLAAGAELMMQRNPDEGWRADNPPEAKPAPNVIVWPTSTETRANTLDLSHLAGRPVREVSPEAMRALIDPTGI